MEYDTIGVLIQTLKRLSVRTDGPFTLASGAVSDLYVDVRQTSLTMSGANLIGQAISDVMLANPDVEMPEAIGGMEAGAIPVAMAAILRCDVDLQAFFIRKTPKGHGLGNLVVHPRLPAGSPVCVVEDVATTGASMLAAIHAMEAAGFRVVMCITVVDRQEGAVGLLAAHGYTLRSLVTRADLVS